MPAIKSTQVSRFVGLVAFSFCLQVALQNLYIACTDADHAVRGSLLVNVGFVAGILVSLVALLIVADRIGRRTLGVVGGSTLGVAIALMVFSGMAAPQYSPAIAICFAAATGATLVVITLRWSQALASVGYTSAIRSVLAANACAVILMFVLFSAYGEVVWFNFTGGPLAAASFKIIVAGLAVAALLLCPTPDDETASPLAAAPVGVEGLVRREGRLFAGLLAFSFCTSLHWEINAMRFGNAFEISWSMLGHEVNATAMAMSYIVLTVIILVVGMLTLRLASERIHRKTFVTILFYCIGSAFFVPGLFGVSYVSPAGLMTVGLFFFTTTALLRLFDDQGFIGLSVTQAATLFFLTLVAGLVAGLATSWAIAPGLYANDVFYNTLTALSLFLVMVAPSLLFRASTPATAGATEVPALEDPFVESCRRVSAERGLSPRETEVMELLARGYSAPAIASTLVISENTVKVHSRHIYEKLGIHTKQELIRMMGANAAIE